MSFHNSYLHINVLILLRVNYLLLFLLLLLFSGKFCSYTANRVDRNQVAHFVRRTVEPICWLWPIHDMSRQLNESQLYSISLAMKNKLQLIQGPPG